MVKLATFLSGAALLILELIGVRMLTPTFGSSVIVYSAVIAVFLAAMAFGYFIGGYIADRTPHRATLRYNARVVDKKHSRLPATIASPVSQLSTRSLGTRRVSVLTGDYAPVETLNLLFR